MAKLAGPVPTNRLVFVDILRALACLWVTVYHLFYFFQAGNLLPRVIELATEYGYLGVSVFLVLSGFCVFSSLSRKLESNAFKVDWRKYLRRRAARLLPAYYAALLICSALALSTGKEVVGLNFYGTLVSHLLLVHNLVPEFELRISGPFWTLGLEFQLYILLLFIVPFINRFGWRITSYMVALMTVATELYLWKVGFAGDRRRFVDTLPIIRFPEFFCGMIASFTYYHRPQIPTRWLWLFAAALPLNVLRFMIFGRNGAFIYPIWGIGFGALLLLGIRSNWKAFYSPMGRALEWIGMISYSIYLVHFPLMMWAWIPLLNLINADLITRMITSLLIFFPILLGMSWLYFRCFEQPFLTKRLAR